ncbi:hypothetical protein [Erythrobacter sp.]|uniref:hypothetical protein n=1 Tax=Erythrobacter sp. TaxID=1042 RepID=UPI003C73E075
MNKKYVDEVRRFGGPKPRIDADGKARNVRHIDEIDPSDVITDGQGNVLRMPLLRRKPCFARPERFLRGLFGSKSWTDDKGVRRPSASPCYTCEDMTLGTFMSCHKVVVERIESSSSIEDAFEEWDDSTAGKTGPWCFNGERRQLWNVFLDVIEAHGGWSNINENQVKVASLAEAKEERRRRKHSERRRRAAERDRRKGLIGPLTPEFFAALDEERDERAQMLKELKKIQGKTRRDTLWIHVTPDDTWDRVADVWRAREILRRANAKETGKAIAEILARMPRYVTKQPAYLQARVSKDLKRIKRLENDERGEPIWPAWSFDA